MPIVNQIAIFLPMLLVIAITFVGFVRMGVARAATMKSGHDPAFYRAHIGPAEPEPVVVAVRHWSNVFELPTLFYAACLTAFVLGAVSGWVLGLAWTYAAARTVQSAVHLTYNNPMHRGLAFMIGALGLLALWIILALEVFARL